MILTFDIQLAAATTWAEIERLRPRLFATLEIETEARSFWRDIYTGEMFSKSKDRVDDPVICHPTFKEWRREIRAARSNNQ